MNTADKPSASAGLAIETANLNKAYRIWRDPSARLKAPIWEALSDVLPGSVQPQFMRKRGGRDGRSPYFHDFYALKDIHLEIGHGEAVGIVGRNGSGKSTLLQIIAGTLTPTSGRARVNGRVAALLELGSGFNPDFTGRENVYLNASILGLTRAEIDERFDDIAAFADIGEFIEQPIKTCSSGMIMRLAFAVVAHVDPDILIIDEALAVGDVRFQRKCAERMSDYREAGKTLLLVSHSGADITRLCDRAVWLDGGKIRRVDRAKPVIEEYHAFMALGAGMIKPPQKSEAPHNSGDGFILHPIPTNACITGDGGAMIEGIAITTPGGYPLPVITHAQSVRITVAYRTEVEIGRLFAGVQIVNAQGMRLLTNSNIIMGEEVPPLAAGTRGQISFEFVMPEISNGSYLIAVGLNDGDFDNHIRLCFVADALGFEVLSTSPYQRQAGYFKITECAFKHSLRS
jgi:lipopolysaccharide transport system ATP-binding protein